MKKPLVSVLDIPLWAGNLELAITHVITMASEASERSNLRISASGAHGLVISKRDNSFKNCLQNFYLNLPDGMPSVWVGRMKGARHMRRCYGPDFFKMIIMSTGALSIKHFFCGGKEGVAEKLKQVCITRFGNSNIVGTFCPPFRDLSDNEWIELGSLIDKCESDIVWIGLSTPKQEKFAERLSKYSKTKFIITVGAAFDFHTGEVKQAPSVFQKIGLEWFFRLLMEPKRLWRRYIEIVPLFTYYNLMEFCKFAFRLKSKS